MWLAIRYASVCLQHGTDPWGFHKTFGNCWFAGRLSVSLKKKRLLLHGASQIFDDDLNDYVPIFRVAGTQYIISNVKGEKKQGIRKTFIFADCAFYGTRKVITCECVQSMCFGE